LLNEAQKLLPVLETLLRRAQASGTLAAEIEVELDQLRQQIFLLGGVHVDVAKTARRRAEHDKSVQETKDALAEIDAIGVQVKDLEKGLLDFPCRIEGELVLLCWRRGETRIEYWHTLEAGFRGRQPLDERFGRGWRDRPN
jgi:hypothetical protein